MNNDISEEAKQAIANGALIRARNRLRRDGCSSDAAMRRRVLLLAAERNLPPAEYAKLLHKRIMTKSITDFCEKHNVSMDWLIYGDLKGLKRMKRWAKEDPGEQIARILRKFGALKPSYQKIILDWIETAAAEDNASA